MTLAIRIAAAMLLAGLTTGCGNLRPNFFGPGRIEQQRINASVHDPYADNQAGPEVVGGRPRDYQDQRPEAVRSQPYYNGLWTQNR